MFLSTYINMYKQTNNYKQAHIYIYIYIFVGSIEVRACSSIKEVK